MAKYAVAHGEMFYLINFFGPFDEFQDAWDWADGNCGLSWWKIVRLENPDAR